MKQNDLTVILTLWDRVDFTYRWMRWMDQQRFPYKILIADGGLDKNIELHLRVRLKTSARITKLSQHEADGGEFQEREGVAVEIFPVLGEAAATVEPCNR